MFCDHAGVLWPIPTGDVSLGNTLVKIDLNHVQLEESFKDDNYKKLFNKSIEVS